MRTGWRILSVMLLVTALAASVQPGDIINKQNLSADYIRTLNRNAATDMADAAVYNPANLRGPKVPRRAPVSGRNSAVLRNISRVT